MFYEVRVGEKNSQSILKETIITREKKDNSNTKIKILFSSKGKKEKKSSEKITHRLEKIFLICITNTGLAPRIYDMCKSIRRN